MTHRDRAGDPPGRRQAAGDAGHRQGFPTPSGGSPARSLGRVDGGDAAVLVARDVGHLRAPEECGKPNVTDVNLP